MQAVLIRVESPRITSWTCEAVIPELVSFGFCYNECLRVDVLLSKPGPDSLWGSCLELNSEALTGRLQGAHSSPLSCVMRSSMCWDPGGEDTQQDGEPPRRSPPHDMLISLLTTTLRAHGCQTFGGLKTRHM